MEDKKQKYIAFSISAGCYFYQLGIAYYIQQNFNLNNIKFSGSSGGSWPAVLLASGEDIKKGFEYVITYAPECTKNRPILGAYMVYDQGIAIVFEKLWSNIHLPSLVNGKLALSVTRLAWDILPYLKDEVVTNFYSNQDILECVIASALIPYALNGKPYVIYRNWICADGGITNVTGVRRFAEELVHDIELIEEGLVEQAHHIKDEFVHNIHDEIFYNENDNISDSSSVTSQQLQLQSQSIIHSQSKSIIHSQQLPTSTGPKDIIQFGVTITMTLIDIITDSLEKIIQTHKQTNTITQSNFALSKHLHYHPSPESTIGIEISQNDNHKINLLESILTSVHPSCQQIINKLHNISTNLHLKYDKHTNNSDNNNHNENNQLEKIHTSNSSIISNCFSYLSNISSKLYHQESLFPDSLISIEDIYSQETHWLGNHISNFGSGHKYRPKYIINRHEEIDYNSNSNDNENTNNTLNQFTINYSDNPHIKTNLLPYFSHTSSKEHLEYKDYQEEDDDITNSDYQSDEQENIELLNIIENNFHHKDSHLSCIHEVDCNNNDNNDNNNENEEGSKEGLVDKSSKLSEDNEIEQSDNMNHKLSNNGWKDDIIVLESGVSLKQIFPSPSSSNDSKSYSSSISSNDDTFTTIKLSPPITGDMSISPPHFPVGSVDCHLSYDHHDFSYNNNPINTKQNLFYQQPNQKQQTEKQTEKQTEEQRQEYEYIEGKLSSQTKQEKQQENQKNEKKQNKQHEQEEFPTDYWKNKGNIIKLIPNNGGIQLEISPWMWRHHSIWNYHLSSDVNHAIKLFNMGISDAFDHHQELQVFFDS